MTLFAFYCRDCARAEALREQVLKEHLAHIEANIDDYAVAGPLKEDGKTIGSLVILRAESREEARAKFESDPYYSAGVWETVYESQFLGVAGDWVGGIGWR